MCLKNSPCDSVLNGPNSSCQFYLLFCLYDIGKDDKLHQDVQAKAFDSSYLQRPERWTTIPFNAINVIAQLNNTLHHGYS